MAFLDLKLKCQSDCRLLGKQTEQVSAKTPPNTLISFWFTRHLEGVFISNYVVNFFFQAKFKSNKASDSFFPSLPPSSLLPLHVGTVGVLASELVSSTLEWAWGPLGSP